MQGIGAGWGDDYFAGLECQWIDVTDVDTSKCEVTGPLTFKSNPERFLCEGTPVVDDKDQLIFEPTDLITETGKRIDRPVCSFVSDYDKNNFGSTPVTLPQTGGLVTSACTRGQVGPRRDCGYAFAAAPTCTAGQMVTLSCTVPKGSAPQQLRLCEYSAVLGGGIACAYVESLASVLIQDGPAVDVTFKCPAARDAREPGGRYSVLTPRVLDADTVQPVTCTPK